MRGSLYWNTVTPLMKNILEQLMACELFQQFRLVGGTSLSLQLGHRASADIDLFTDAQYDTVDFKAIDNYLRATFSYVTEPTPGPVGMGRPYFIGDNEEECIKLDLYYTDPFIQPALVIENVRMATVEEIIAMKINVVQRGGRKKDFWDLHEIMDNYLPEQMIALHEQRYPYDHDEELIRSKFIDFSNADNDYDPECLRGKYWELIKLDITRALQPYVKIPTGLSLAESYHLEASAPCSKFSRPQLPVVPLFVLVIVYYYHPYFLHLMN